MLCASSAWSQENPSARNISLTAPSPTEVRVEVVQLGSGVRSYGMNVHIGDQPVIAEPALIQGWVGTYSVAPRTRVLIVVRANFFDFFAPESLNYTASITTTRLPLAEPTMEQITISLDEDNHRFVVSWDNVIEGVLEYELSLGVNGEASQVNRTVSALIPGQTTFNLSENSAHSLAVVALNDENPASNAYRQEISTIPLPAPAITNAATNVEAGGMNLWEFAVFWEAVEDATAYHLNIYHISNTQVIQSADVSEASLTHIFGGLRARRTYRVEVIARSRTRFSSEASMRTVATRQARLPVGPQNVKLTAQTNGIKLDFYNPFRNSIQFYRIYVSRRGAALSNGQFSRSIIDNRVIDVSSGRNTTTHGPFSQNLYFLEIHEYGNHGYSESSQASYSLSTRLALHQPRPTAKMEARRENIRVAWQSVSDTQMYRVRLYEGAGNMDEEAQHATERTVSALELLIDDVALDDAHYTVGVTAQRNGFPSSEEARVTIRPSTLQEGSFDLERGIDSLNLSWRSDEPSDSDFYSKTAFASLHISVEDTASTVVKEEREVSTTANTYSIDGLDEGTDYALKIISRVTLGGVSVDAETLSIPFRTFAGQLPRPTREQISWTADQ
ncbi:MAG: fibronectin type III domain-containing protein, partial [Candidatus Oxydemutatoraceae bacterium WSBS_2016_MAG_OTU14]